MRNKEAWELPGEEWRPITGFVWFEVSNLGRVRSMRVGRVCTQGKHRQGYRLVAMEKMARHVHRLVAAAFIPNPENYLVVHHKDSNPSNNRVENLQWTTQKENIRMAMELRGNWLKGHPKRATPIVRIDPESGERTKYPSIRAAAEAYNAAMVANGGIAKPCATLSANICHAKIRGVKAYGFRWENSPARRKTPRCPRMRELG